MLVRIRILLFQLFVFCMTASSSLALANNAHCVSLFQPASSLRTPTTRILAIAAPSGGGKTTLMEMLRKDFPLQFSLLLETTTRPPRGAEVHGRDYNFMAVEKYQQLLSQNAFVDSSHFAGNYYGHLKSDLDAIFADGKTAIVLVSPYNLSTMKSLFGENVLTIFIEPPSLPELEKRLRDRGTDSEESIQRRLKNAKFEMENKPTSDSTLVNGDLKDTYKALLKLLKMD